MKFLRLLLAAAFALLSQPALAQQDAPLDGGPKVHVRLVAEQSEIAPGGKIAVALVQTIRAGWHTYWRNPGEAGEATALDWSLPSGWKAGALAWPFPKLLPAGPLMNYGYDGEPWLLTTLTAPPATHPGDIVTLKAHASWLVCSATLCVPEDADVTLPLAVSAKPAPPYATIALAFDAARARLPIGSPWPAHFAFGNTLDLFLAAPNLAPQDAHFFPFDEGIVAGSAVQSLGTAAGGIVLRLAHVASAKPPRALAGVLELTSADGSIQALDISAVPGSVPSAHFADRGGTGLALALLFALVGGLILNLMPCVLPVLAMKALAVASKAGADRKDAARQGLAYGAGAIASFLALGLAIVLLRSAGEAIGWGFQLQDPRVVAAFALLMFAVGLSLSGVVEFPSGFGGGESLARKSGALGAFFTGVLAVAVAAPCTAPFMAAAIGAALTQGTGVALAIFFFLGAGFAAPFVILGLSPGLLRLLPRPGAWMVHFKQLLAFPMFAASAWLVWVEAQEAGQMGLAASLAAIVALAFGAWAWSATRQSGESWRRAGGLLAILALCFAGAGVALAGSGAAMTASIVNATSIPAEPYTPERLAQLRGADRAVFVDATAAWCITCLVNERVALSSADVAQSFARTHTAFLIADWTKRDAAITRLLAAHDRSGVPLYLYYKPGAAEADVLPQILTPDAVLKVVEGQ